MDPASRQPSDFIIVTTSTPDEASARALLQSLLERRLIACGRMTAERSLYWWKNEICEAGETVLTIKTRAALFEAVRDAIREDHAYDLPLIVATPVSHICPEIAAWIAAETKA